MLSDGLHLSRAGYELVTALMVDALERTLTSRRTRTRRISPLLDVDHRAPSASVDAFVVKMRAARGEAFEM